MLDDEWLSRRKALQDRYFEVAKLGDASRIAYLHGPEVSWTEEEVAKLWERAVANPVSDMEPLNCIYVHVPFCKSICHFCNYDRLQPSSPMLLKTWLARVLRSIEVIAPTVRPLTFHALYFGGGTPSVLPARMLGELLEALEGSFSWHPLASRKLEFDPAVMNRERLKVLASHGFQKLSFGIETLDPEVNARHNRGRQGIEVIERCFEDLKAVGIADIACDFLLGLEGTTAEGMLAEMETVLTRFRPEVVDIFMITPTQSYLQRHFGGSWEAFWKHIARFEELVPAALPALAERTGYVVQAGKGHHMMLTRKRARISTAIGLAAQRGMALARQPSQIAAGLRRFGLRCRMVLRQPSKVPGWLRELFAGRQERFFYTALTSAARRPLNVVGLGRSARSNIFGAAAFAVHDPEDNPAIEGPASYVGNAITVADEARSFLAHFMRDNDAVDRAEFRRIFGADMAEVIPAALEAWAKEGTARLDDKALRFVPQDRRERIRSLLWLVPEEAMEFDLAHFGQLELSPAGVARLAAPIQPGTVLAGGYVFAGADGTRLLVRTPEGGMRRLRIAPALADNAPLRLLPDETSKNGDDAALTRAAGQLGNALTQIHRRQSGQGVARR